MPRWAGSTTPACPTTPTTRWRKKYLSGKASGLLTFGVKSAPGPGPRSRRALPGRLQLFTRLVNIGDAKSLATHPASTTHRQLSPAELAKAGVGEDAVRLSVGIEHIDDLMADLEQAPSACGDVAVLGDPGGRHAGWRTVLFHAQHTTGLEHRKGGLQRWRPGGWPRSSCARCGRSAPGRRRRAGRCRHEAAAVRRHQRRPAPCRTAPGRAPAWRRSPARLLAAGSRCRVGGRFSARHTAGPGRAGTAPGSR
jgi:hypothetical protein